MAADSDTEITIGPTGKGKMVHGGFRSNRHHQGIENLANPESMGRDLLQRTEKMDSGDGPYHKKMMGSVTPGGSGGRYRVSKWSGKR